MNYFTSMGPLSPLPAVVAIAVAAGISALLARIFGAPEATGRFTTIDGLRGWLGFFVFLHHGSVWHLYLRTGQWTSPTSALYSHFGASSVAAFFMITGFLFYTKLLDSRGQSVDWFRLFVSRILRLWPLYLVAMLVLFAIVGHLTGWQLRVPLTTLVVQIIQWLAFAVPGAPDLNGLPMASKIMAGVTWSLRYEWMFYLALPVLALSVGLVAPWRYLGLAALTLSLALFGWGPEWIMLMAFGGGMVAAMLVKLKQMRTIAGHRIGSVLVVCCVALAVGLYHSAYSPVPMLLLSIAFILIACGCTVFGLLGLALSRTLGELAYSIYLLHGFALYVVFQFVIGAQRSAVLTPVEHWTVVVTIAPALLVICFTLFHLVEQPAMRSSARVVRWFRLDRQKS